MTFGAQVWPAKCPAHTLGFGPDEVAWVGDRVTLGDRRAKSAIQ